MSLLRYHGFNNWQKMVLPEEDDIKDNIICFAFELEVTQDVNIDYDYSYNNHSPEDLADRLNQEFGNLFVYERDSSIDNGVEIISQPMSLKFYLANLNKFKKMIEICKEFKYISHDSGKCGLHIHFSRSAFGFNKKDYDKYVEKIGNKIYKVEKLRINKTIENICLILETYKNEFIKISGRNEYQIQRWCSFETVDNNSDILEIKSIIKEKFRGRNTNRRKVVNTNNEKTIEIRLCRGTLLWESLHTKILLMYHLVDIARNYTGLLSFKKIILWKESQENIDIIKNYIENNSNISKRINIDEVTRKVSLSLDTEFRINSVDFMK